MNIWEMLGIEPTEDISKIKSAYARQARLYHPEEHPEEFKMLQNAYKVALQLAKSKRTGITVTYTPSVQTEEPAEETMPEAAETVEETMPEATETVEETMPEAVETVEETEPDDAHTFDFSGVDAYGDREHFLRQFLLLSKNPYLKNNLVAWDYFLHLDRHAGLFSNTDFRREMVRAICSTNGWRRKTILYFERFLSGFHAQENTPEDGKWETDLRAFRRKKLPRLRMPAFCMDRFLLKEGKEFHKQLRTRISKSVGREIDLDIQADLIKYMKLYLSVGETGEAYIDRLHRGWRFEQAYAFGLTAFICIFVIMAVVQASPVGQKGKTPSEMEYLQELYAPDLFPEAEDDQKFMLREYQSYWRTADNAMDDVQKRYERWQRQ